MKIAVIHGPNLQLLGHRPAEHYGTRTLQEINDGLARVAAELGVEIVFFQTNHEGAIVDFIAEAMTNGTDGIVINPAAYTHTSIAIRDALEAVRIPAVEVHLSNINEREEFRHVSLTAPVCIGQVVGMGPAGYEHALRALVQRLKQSTATLTQES